MTDTIQKTITALDERTIDHFNAIAALVNVIDDVHPGDFTAEELKAIEAFAGRIVDDVENRTIDTYTAVSSIDEARKLAAAGVPDLPHLIAIGGE